MAQGGRPAPRSSSADRGGQGAGGAAGSTLQRSWRKVRARTLKLSGWLCLRAGAGCSGYPGCSQGGGRLGEGVRFRRSSAPMARGGTWSPPLWLSLRPLPRRGLGLFPGPVHPVRASGAEALPGQRAQVLLPWRRAASGRAPRGPGAAPASVLGGGDRPVGAAAPPRIPPRGRREKSRCGLGEALPRLAARGKLRGPEGVGHWLRARRGCQPGKGAGWGRPGGHPKAGRPESARPSSREMSSSERPRGCGHLLLARRGAALPAQLGLRGTPPPGSRDTALLFFYFSVAFFFFPPPSFSYISLPPLPSFVLFLSNNQSEVRTVCLHSTLRPPIPSPHLLVSAGVEGVRVSQPPLSNQG